MSQAEPFAPQEDRPAIQAIDPLDFGYLDALPRQRAGQGRLHLGRALGRTLGRAAVGGAHSPALLFVHGAHHGAWCFAAYLAFFDALGIPAAALDLRGHGGLLQDAAFCRQGVAAMAEDVAAACALLGPRVIPIGHSAGALVAASAAMRQPIAGLGLLAPSPPGNLPGAATVETVFDGSPLPVPPLAAAQARYLDETAPRDVSRFHARLCPESPALMNDRYGLRVSIDPRRITVPGFCLAAGRDSPRTHPPGQDRAVANFFGFRFTELPDAPHCYMLARDWSVSARYIAAWYARQFTARA